jgi:glycosyltransferase involved in cell wall biosynthesis
MIKVLRVITRLNVGGPSKQVGVLSKLFDEENISQLIVTGSTLDSEQEIDIKQFKDRIIKIKELSREINLVADLVALMKLCLIIVRYKPNIIHTHLSKAWAISTIAKFLCRSKAVSIHTFHGHILHSYFSKLSTYFIVIILRILANRTDILIALNKSNRQSLISARIGKESKYVEIRPGFDSISVDSKEVAKKSLGLDPSIFIIGYVGRFEKIKRIDLLSEVIALSTTKFPNVQFITFGNGPEFKQFHERTKHFSVLNFSWIDDLKIAYSVIDLLILVSDNEGTPLVVIESGLCGIPTLSRNVGGVSDLISDGVTGFITGNSTEEIVSKLEFIVNTPETYVKVSSQVKKQFSLNYNEKDFLKAHNELYLRSLK